MFYYLSFLRPPPTHVALGTTGITITPQIANDLRTELYPEPQDVYYAWAPCVSSIISPSTPLQTSKPAKLTTWRTAHAYKEVLVPPPQGAKDGHAYRLVLTAHAQGVPHIVNLAGHGVGGRPFPVISMPIVFSRGKPPSGAGKQEQVERIYRVAVKSEEQAFMSIREKTSFDLDKKIWDSGIGLSAWLVELTSRGSASSQPQLCQDLWSLLFERESCQIIELGAGTGAVSLTLGALRSISHGTQVRGSILATDLESAMPLLRRNISENEGLFHCTHARPHAVVLDWDDPNMPDEVAAVQDGFDIIVMADVTYNTASFPALVRTLRHLLRLSPKCMVLVGYKERHAEERTLWDMVGDIGLCLEKLDERAGAGGAPVEIWAARWSGEES